MSEQVLRNPKGFNRGRNSVSGKCEDQRNNGSVMTLTKVKSPINNRITDRYQKRASVVDRSIKVGLQQNDSSSEVYSKQTIGKRVDTFGTNGMKMNQPNYHFYNDRFNASSDDSFGMDSSFRQSHKRYREMQIVQRFSNSRKQIQELLKQSRQVRQQREQIIYTKRKNDHVDKKQAKRQRLAYYHCDSIIIKPEFRPIKVIELSINPVLHKNITTNNHQNRSNLPRLIQADESFSSNSKYESVKKNLNSQFMESFGESPFQKLSNSMHQCEVDSPSFLNGEKVRAQKSKVYKTNRFCDDYSPRKKIFSQKINDSKSQHIPTQERQRTASEHQSNQDYTEKSSKQAVPTYSFKRRNKIFNSDKKSGLKLSRAIRHEQQLSKLQGQLGVDVFHIIIQEEEFLRQCCT